MLFCVAVENFPPIRKQSESYHGEQNRGYHVKEHKKVVQKHVSKLRQVKQTVLALCQLKPQQRRYSTVFSPEPYKVKEV